MQKCDAIKILEIILRMNFDISELKAKGDIWQKNKFISYLRQRMVLFKIKISNLNRREILHVANFVLNLGDSNWYRALVKEILPNGNFKVHFVDYGNVEEVTADELRMIPSRFLKLPFQGIRCWLVGMMQNETFSQLSSNTWIT